MSIKDYDDSHESRLAEGSKTPQESNRGSPSPELLIEEFSITIFTF
jgi:hypothetical protein